MSLSDASIRTAKPGAATYDLSDDRPRGLALRVHPSGRKTWAIRLAVRGKDRVRREIGEYPATGLREARQRAEEWRALARQGIDPGHVKPEREELTLRAAVDEWLTHHKLRSEHQIRRRFDLHVFGFEKLGDRDVTEIEQRDVARLLRKMQTAGTPAEANRVRGSLSSLYGWLMKQGEVTTNPALGTAKAPEPSLERQREGSARVLTMDELKAIWGAAEADKSPVVGALVRLLILVPLRRQEWTDLRWSEIERMEGGKVLIRIPAGRMKGKREHIVPLPAQAVEIIDALPRISETYVFAVNEGRPFAGWRSGAERIRDAAGLTMPWTIHDLRRGVATAMGDAGISDGLIARILAHSPRTLMGITATYEKSNRLDQLRAALEQWQTILGHALAPSDNVVPMRAEG